MTLAEGYAAVLAHLDDEDGRRFAPTVSGAADYTNVHRALRSSLSRCIDDMAAAGVDRLVREVSATADSSGDVDLSAYDPADIRGVFVIPTGTVRYPVDEGNRLERYSADTAERDVVVRIRQRYDIPAKDDTTALLIGSLDGEARSWPALDEWVCARAALQAGVKDKDRREGLMALLVDLERSVLASPRIPRTMPYPPEMPARRTYYRLRWLWDDHARTLKLIVVDGSI